VTGDCGAIQNIFADHHYAANGAHAAAVALNAGTDLDCGNVFPKYLGSAFVQGLYTNETLDTALIRLYSSLVKLGYFDPADGQPYRSIGWGDVSTPTAEELAHKATLEGIVLLKNNETLPLKSNGSLAIIGPYANAITQLQGNYAGPPKYIRTLLWAAAHQGYDVKYSKGTDINTDSSSDFAEAIAAAKEADIVIYAGGIDNTIEAESKDRTTIIWPGNQLDLIEQLSGLKKPFIVVQYGGGQVDDSLLLTNSDVGALLWAGYPSQAGGAAIFDILTGKSAPAGRLPVTQYPDSYVDEVPMTDMNLRPGANNPGRTYRWYDKAVLPFGFGLHYTNFDVAWDLGEYGPYDTESVTQGSTDKPVDTALFETFSITVTNAGKVTSDYVALLFLNADGAGPEPYPIKTLIGYSRAKGIRPGKSRRVEIEVSVGSVARTAENGDLVLYPGAYKLEVDVGKDFPTVTFTVSGNEKVLDDFPEPQRNVSSSALR
jgi:beta-D-xylosidase 4